MPHADSRRFLGTAILALSLLATGAVTSAHAQATPAGGAQGGSSTTTEDNNGDEGFDTGLLGLLGLAGLLGLRKRDTVRVDRVDTTASTRPRV